MILRSFQATQGACLIKLSALRTLDLATSRPRDDAGCDEHDFMNPDAVCLGHSQDRCVGRFLGDQRSHMFPLNLLNNNNLFGFSGVY